MPRKPRLDIQGCIYHIINRGIEKRSIFLDDNDKKHFIDLLARILTETNTMIFAFALIPNHFHILIMRGTTPVSDVMRSITGGYAQYFNKKYNRSGYLFQGRYKAILCQKEPYFLELVRYINLNPIRVGIVRTVSELSSYKFSSHPYISGKIKSDWFNPDHVLNQFASSEKKAIGRYIKFIEDGIGHKTDLSGGGLIRSLKYLGKSEEKIMYDDRVLGDGDFVYQVLLDEEGEKQKTNKVEFDALLSIVCNDYNLTASNILGKTRVGNTPKARATLAYLMSSKMGSSSSDIAKQLQCTSSAVSKMIGRASKES